VLELVEHALDLVAQAEHGLVETGPGLAPPIVADHRADAVNEQFGFVVVAVVSRIRQEVLGVRQVEVDSHQRRKLFAVRGFAAGDQDGERSPGAVATGLEPARKAAARATKSLLESPPFAPAA